ncbi:MAG: homogentisate 1,2-dioxygenase [Myxococcaceae bacterium]
MLDRMAVGTLAKKHHIALRDGQGQLLFEECWTREGFDGPYTILYHQKPPHTQRLASGAAGFALPEAAPQGPLAKRHYVTPKLSLPNVAPAQARMPILFNEDVVISVMRPGAKDAVLFSNGDADDVYFVHEGGGRLESALGSLSFEKDDYVIVPRGLAYRLIPTPGLRQNWLSIECLGGLHLPKQWRNASGQLRMDAPYSHRDFRRPEFRGPADDGIRDVVVKKNGAFHGFRYTSPPFDVVGWDGSVYPFVFPILNFQPRAGLVHLPPDWHGTFAARGALICSFVPRTTDFHPEAVPCPYPHASVDCDEFLYYVRGQFTSRRGIGEGSVSYHPAGVAHGPHPGAYEASVGTRSTNELAVMIDTYRPMRATRQALACEDPGYQDSFVA